MKLLDSLFLDSYVSLIFSIAKLRFSLRCMSFSIPVSVSKLEGFISNREQSYEDPIEE